MIRYAKLLAELLRLSWRLHPLPTAGLLALRLATVPTTPAMALALRAAVDGIVHRDPGTAAAGAAVAVIAYAVGMYLRSLADTLEVMIGDRIGTLHIRRHIEEHLARLDGLEHLERTDLLDRITVLRGAGWRLNHAPWQAVAAGCDALRLGLLLLLLAAVTPWLLLLLGFAAAPLWFDQRGQRSIVDAETRTAEAFRLQRHLFNLATAAAGGKELRVSGAGPEIARRQRQAWEAAVDGRFRARLRAAAWSVAGWTLYTAGFATGLVLLIDRTAHGQATAGDLVLAVTVAVTLRNAVQETLFAVSHTTSGRTVVEPLLWLRDYVATSRSTGRRTPPATLRAGITLDRVAFTYPGTGRPALDDFSCHLPAGAVVAVVGEYGSGKTTLVKLLTKLYPPDRGRIEVDGVDLADLATTEWRARISAAFQDFGRFHIPFGETVGIGDLTHLHDTGRITDAVHAADARPLVDRLPDGLDTQLGRQFDGVDLSEGQWQRTALARASMRTDPLLFVLDEPTASLDAPSEHHIFRRYLVRARELAARTGAITVIVSHRFSTVTGADHILVLHQGRLVERGTHDELLAAGGRYANLYNIQATAYRRPASDVPMM
ncbi:ABC transporter ATP-binding protein [Phytohabitans rumicis]|uniref:ABC transporter permease n=1 Tax=Phytohabitans rumicis TaxID=1076125 RepID=A0A6V8KMZ4_9ACTN|nr:ABC transporter ATP-binding protein [Phytohabitans rumicis]GFJ86542.1 ABC transporter permease [Phytohabitans rumicis]